VIDVQDLLVMAVAAPDQQRPHAVLPAGGLYSEFPCETHRSTTTTAATHKHIMIGPMRSASMLLPSISAFNPQTTPASAAKIGHALIEI
jgi:hypothetical protein